MNLLVNRATEVLDAVNIETASSPYLEKCETTEIGKMDTNNNEFCEHRCPQKLHVLTD